MPVGAVVVKEKYADPSASGPLRGYSVMTKRPPGSDPERGDWEYAYVSLDGQRTVASGRALSGCATCHASSRSTDFLFRSHNVPAATPPVTQPSSGVTAPFDSDPRHLWNKLHSALLVRMRPTASGSQTICSRTCGQTLSISGGPRRTTRLSACSTSSSRLGARS